MCVCFGQCRKMDTSYPCLLCDKRYRLYCIGGGLWGVKTPSWRPPHALKTISPPLLDKCFSSRYCINFCGIEPSTYKFIFLSSYLQKFLLFIALPFCWYNNYDDDYFVLLHKLDTFLLHTQYLVPHHRILPRTCTTVTNGRRISFGLRERDIVEQAYLPRLFFLF
jgi:hypothetical protein